MKPSFTSLGLFVVALATVMVVNCQQNQINRVILGILTQEWKDTPDSYIAASYVKHLESAGARVVPILIHKPDEYYEEMMSFVNGLLLPGGANDPVRSGYATAVPTLLNIAIKLNQNGTHFPVWGTCVSFEKMVEYFANTTDWVTKCEADNLSAPTKFVDSKTVKNSRLFKHSETFNRQNIIQIMSTENVTAHYHRKCITDADFHKLKLDTKFTMLSTNQFENVTSVSIIESKEYPFYGTSFHPEKMQFEFVVSAEMGNINHDSNAVLVGQYFANFLVNEARQNGHHFPDKKQELQALIYNYERTYTGNKPDSYFEEIYLFSGSATIDKLWSTVAITIVSLMANNLFLSY